MKTNINQHSELIEEVSKLIEETIIINCKHTKKYEKTGEKFNIFEILNVERNEVRICKVIAELLNPKGCHCQGNKYLLKFIEIIASDEPELREIIENQFSNDLSVDTEYIIDITKRRIDIVIRGKNIFIPIEVKIDAGDQESQCKDYLDYASKYNKLDGYNCKLYYLTLDGSLPNEKSVKDMAPIYLISPELENDDKSEGVIIGFENIKCLSFKEHIIKWLDSCMDNKVLPINEILVQFRQTLVNITGGNNNMVKDEVTKLITDERGMAAAKEITLAYDEASTNMIKKIFDEIDFGQTNNNKNEELINFDYCGENHNYKDYYKKAVYPGKSCYLCDYNASIEIWLRVEINSSLFIGLCVVPKEKNDSKYWEESLLDENEDIYLRFLSIINNGTECPRIDKKKSWWLAWEYIGYGDPKKVNFKNREDDFIELFNENNFNAFVRNINNKINDYLKLVEEFQKSQTK